MFDRKTIFGQKLAFICTMFNHPSLTSCTVFNRLNLSLDPHKHLYTSDSVCLTTPSGTTSNEAPNTNRNNKHFNNLNLAKQ